MGCADCVRIIVFFFNLIFALAGIGLIVLGTLYNLNLVDLTESIPSLYKGISLVPILTIAVGGLVFLIAFFGCCGAFKSNSCLLTSYSVILLTIFLIKISIGVYAFLEIQNKQDFEVDINNTINRIFIGYGKNSKDSKLVDTIQEELDCCGTYGSKYWTTKGSTIPDSCCENNDCKLIMYTDGCQKKAYNFLVGLIDVIGITILCLSTLEVLGAILSLCLANSIRNNFRKGPYSY